MSDMPENIRLNNLSPSQGSRHQRHRVGRGVGSGSGKTCGRGHKGQRSRSGGGVPATFEGGQMPLHRRIPKRGFVSRSSLTRIELNLDDLRRAVDVDEISIASLRSAGRIPHYVKEAKIVSSGMIDRAVVVKGIKATKTAHAAIKTAGGSVE